VHLVGDQLTVEHVALDGTCRAIRRVTVGELENGVIAPGEGNAALSSCSSHSSTAVYRGFAGPPTPPGPGAVLASRVYFPAGPVSHTGRAVVREGVHEAAKRRALVGRR